MQTIIYIIGNNQVLGHIDTIKTELDRKGIRYKLTPIKKTNLGHYETELFIKNTNDTEITNFDLMAFISEHKAIIGNIKVKKEILRYHTPLRTRINRKDKALELLRQIDRAKNTVREKNISDNPYRQRKEYSGLNREFKPNNTMTLREYQELKKSCV
jgi:hypothetical protein